MNRAYWMDFRKPHSIHCAVWLIIIIAGVLCTSSCKKENATSSIVLALKTGVGFTPDSTFIPEGGRISIGIMATGTGSPITYLHVDKITPFDTISAVDKGMYLLTEGCDTTLVYSKDANDFEIWKVTVMNADRVMASKSIRFNKSEGSAYGDIFYFPSVILGFQNNLSTNHYLDIDKGLTYKMASVGGHEKEVDMLCYYYLTSGKSSPTFISPAYETVGAYYPEINSWNQRNDISFDYYSTDNDLITIAQFDAATNDSLLVNAYQVGKVSGNCKFCYTGKTVPFKTQAGKMGLIKVIHADEDETGSVEIAIKVQK
jgi:hypothetical protein